MNYNQGNISLTHEIERKIISTSIKIFKLEDSENSTYTSSPMKSFADIELMDLRFFLQEQAAESYEKGDFTKEITESLARKYHDCIAEQYQNFKSFDALVHSLNRSVNFEDENYDDNEIYFVDYMLAKGINKQFVELDKLDHALGQLRNIIIQTMISDFIENGSFDIEINEEIKQVIKKILYLSDSPITPLDQQTELKKGVYVWYLQIVRDIDLQANFNNMPKIFDVIEQEFKTLFNLESNPATSEQPGENKPPDFPKDIFLNYQSYAVFCTLAKAIYMRQSICYFYRRMYEEGFILVMDKDFRKWFNTAGFPITLMSPTETLAKCYSNERQKYVDLVYKLKGLSTDNQ
ncbi:hypothetical protein [Psychroflexus aestuariivivens]|uniref:hypothetical protein n=1 Tax=Psychroflexus aestuariivivens TaxID=1795040 RepID=UPI000FD6DD2D|nr:hypothetical protein [Psychroflexus aestuariivivens]